MSVSGSYISPGGTSSDALNPGAVLIGGAAMSRWTAASVSLGAAT
ncbi:MAG: hypothetical protein AB7I25_14405 [Vicinamibacterales bacterium]